jgi:long-chain acyl-CoA synthetase
VSEPVGYPAGCLDELLCASAHRDPDRLAVRTTTERTSYAELDDRVSAFAAGLRRLLGPGGCAIGIANVLDPVFAVGFYGVLRSGNVAVIVDPLLPLDGMVRALGTSRAAAAILPGVAAAALAPFRDTLPDLAHVISYAADGPDFPAPVLDEVAVPQRGGLPSLRDPADTAVVQFTSGTTGRPKGVCLTHRNLVVNAVQAARAHQLDRNSVTVNHMPTFQPMHLDSAVYVGATQVLCPEASTVRAVATANRYDASHLYSPPARLAALAAHPCLSRLHLDAVWSVLTGGAALESWAGAALRHQFGVAVVQGYGLAEMSSLTHSACPDDPVLGSVGPVVPDTGCRIVNVVTRAPVGPGTRGEVQVRGPQLMAGYLDPVDVAAVDRDGWLSTGDVGHLDKYGRLFLVNRIHDVLRCGDRWVAPSEVEEILAAHPAVADGVVVDVPDARRGGMTCVAWSRPRPRETTMGGAMATVVNRLTVTGDPAEFERIIGWITEYMSSCPGFIEHRLMRSLRRPEVYVEFARWENADAHRRAMEGEQFRARVGELSAVATADPDVFADIEGAHAAPP